MHDRRSTQTFNHALEAPNYQAKVHTRNHIAGTAIEFLTKSKLRKVLAENYELLNKLGNKD
jgi:hypothetical protein